MSDELLNIAEETVEINEIKKMLKNEGVKIRTVNTWLPKYVYMTVYGAKETQLKMAREFEVSRNTLWKYSTEEGVENVVNELKMRQFKKYELKMYSFLNESLDSLMDIIKNSTNDSARLRAVEIMLKKFNIWDDKQKVELSGIQVPIINIITDINDTDIEEG